MEESRLQKQLDFLMEIDKSKQVGRQTYIVDASKKENDAEHAWHLGIMAFLLSEYANEEVDVLHVMKMVLTHDLIEIDAGDTYAYDEEGNKSKREREVKAAERIFNILPENQAKEMRLLWEEFEAGETKESKFANALDHIQPILLNNASGGKSWKEHGVEKNQILNRNSNTSEGSEQLWNYCKELISQNVLKGNIKE